MMRVFFVLMVLSVNCFALQRDNMRDTANDWLEELQHFGKGVVPIIKEKADDMINYVYNKALDETGDSLTESENEPDIRDDDWDHKSIGNGVFEDRATLDRVPEEDSSEQNIWEMMADLINGWENENTTNDDGNRLPEGVKQKLAIWREAVIALNAASKSLFIEMLGKDFEEYVKYQLHKLINTTTREVWCKLRIMVNMPCKETEEPEKPQSTAEPPPTGNKTESGTTPRTKS